jgi:ATP-binding cassette, subfamily B, bacterial
MNVRKNQDTANASLPMFGLPRLWPYIRPYRGLLFVNIVLGALSSLIDACFPLFNSYALNHFVAEGTL